MDDHLENVSTQMSNDSFLTVLARNVVGVSLSSSPAERLFGKVFTPEKYRLTNERLK